MTKSDGEQQQGREEMRKVGSSNIFLASYRAQDWGSGGLYGNFHYKGVILYTHPPIYKELGENIVYSRSSRSKALYSAEGANINTHIPREYTYSIYGQKTSAQE